MDCLLGTGGGKWGPPRGAKAEVCEGAQAFCVWWWGGSACSLDLPPLPLCVCRMGGAEGQRVRGGVLGLGLLLGGAVFAHGLALGATKAEILAINDDGERPQREQCWEGGGR